MSDRRERGLLALSFFLPFFLLLGIYVLLGIAPFGDRVLLISDARGQYLSYFALYQELFAGKADFFYSFEKLLGGSLSGLYAYYLASPFNLLLLLFPKEQLAAGFDLMLLLKLSTCALTMGLYLRNTRGLRPSSLLFTTAYALCGYNNAYAWCIMWIDAVLMLPLIALGIERLWKEEKPLLYVLSLGLAIISCFYTGYMLCLFSVLYFLWRVFSDTHSLRELPWRKLLHYALASLLAGGVSAVLLIPGFRALSGGVPISPYFYTAKYTYPAALRILHALFPGRSDVDGLVLPTLLAVAACFLLLACAAVFLLRQKKKRCDLAAALLIVIPLMAWFHLIERPFCRELGYPEFRYLTKLLLGYVPFWEFYGGGPNFYAGSAAFLLGLSFFLNRAVPRREKIAGGLLIAALFVSACFYLPNLVWHGFEENNCFNYRWAFAFPFVLLNLASRSFDAREGLRPAGILLPWAGGMAAMVLAFLHPLWFQENWMLLACAAFLTAETALLLIALRGSSRAEGLLCILGIAALCLTTGLSFREQSGHGPSAERLRSQIVSEQARIDDARPADGGFTRLRKDGVTVNYNDPMLFSYPGLVHFSSAEKLSTIAFLSRLGQSISPEYWANGDAGESRAADVLLGVGRYLGADGVLDYTQLADGLWENPWALPLSYLADSGAAGEIAMDDAVCENINRIFSRLTGTEQAIFLPAKAEGLTLTVERGDPIYLQSWSPAITGCTVYSGGEALASFSDLHYPNAVYLGAFEPGETLTVEVSGEGEIPDAPETVLYYEDGAALARCAEVLQADRCEVSIPTASHLEIRTAADRDRLLVLTLPADDGWSLTLDGEKQEIKTALSILMAVPLTAGEHSLSLRYTPPGLVPGAILTALSLTVLAVWELLRRKQNHA